MKIFISHSSRDEQLTATFVTLLRTALPGLRADDIRCTSVDGYRFDPGTDFEERLRHEVFAAEVFIAILTPRSLASTFVLYELGARWAAEKPVLAMRVGGLEQRLLEGPLARTQAVDASREEEIDGLLIALSKRLNIAQERRDAIAGHLKAFLMQSGESIVSERRQGVNPLADVQIGGSAPSVGTLLSPLEGAEVPHSATVSGLTERLQPDVRLWLVVEIGNGALYPQTPVTSRLGPWSTSVRVGRSGRGLDSGSEYKILLVVLGPDTDFQYARYIRGIHESKDGMGSVWPADMVVLDSRLVIRGPQ